MGVSMERKSGSEGDLQIKVIRKNKQSFLKKLWEKILTGGKEHEYNTKRVDK